MSLDKAAKRHGEREQQASLLQHRDDEDLPLGRACRIEEPGEEHDEYHPQRLEPVGRGDAVECKPTHRQKMVRRHEIIERIVLEEAAAGPRRGQDRARCCHDRNERRDYRNQRPFPSQYRCTRPLCALVDYDR